MPVEGTVDIVAGILLPERPLQEVELGKVAVGMLVVDKHPAADTVAEGMQQAYKQQVVVRRRNCN